MKGGLMNCRFCGGQIIGTDHWVCEEARVCQDCADAITRVVEVLSGRQQA